MRPGEFLVVAGGQHGQRNAGELRIDNDDGLTGARAMLARSSGPRHRRGDAPPHGYRAVERRAESTPQAALRELIDRIRDRVGDPSFGRRGKL